ncbi:MAG: hypothetical protein BMS9Abin02_0654 [Anaerolineae bacterium]|nr:MAG: hypothetical protein BMS9Abin02_0654 [Anaerolineae bacterium]
MTKRMISATNHHFNALSKINLDDFLACFKKDATLADPYRGKPYAGKEGLSKWFNGIRRSWKGFSIEAEEAFNSGDRAAVKWTDRGGKFWKECNFFRHRYIDEDGLITRIDGYWDAPSMMAQIR